MSKTVYRSIPRRTSLPRNTRSTGGISGTFETLLAKLTFASSKLERSRPRKRR